MSASTKKQSSHLYLFFGEEGFLIQEQVKKIIDTLLPSEEQDFNLVSLDADPSVSELLQLVESAPFFGEYKIVLVKNSKLFQASRRKASVAENPEDEIEVGGGSDDEANDSVDVRLLDLFARMPSYAALIFTAAKADKRRRIVKTISEYGQVREMNPFRSFEEREIRDWVEDRAAGLGKRLQQAAVEHLMAVVGTMQQIPRGFLAAELEKAALYVGSDPVIDKASLETVMAAVPEVSAFAMTEALARRNTTQALARLEELFVNREPPLKIIGLLAFKVRQWLQIRQILDRRGGEDEMIDAIGAKGGRFGAAKRIIAQSRSFRTESLKNGLLTLADANSAIRAGGDPRVYLERVVIELCR